MRALALSGGGARIHYQVGAVCWLLGECKTNYDLFCGISSGALVAAYLAQYREGEETLAAELLERATGRLKRADVLGDWRPFSALHGLFGRSSFYSSKPFHRFVQTLIDPNLIRGSGKRLRIGAISMATGEFHRFTETSGGLLGAVLASSAFPGVLEPVEVYGQQMVDGGARVFTPIGAAIESGATHVDVVLTGPVRSEYQEFSTPSALEALVRSTELATDEILQRDLQMARLNNEMALTKARPDKRLITMNIIRPANALPIGVLDFDSTNVEVTRSLGHQDARLVVPGLANYRSSLF